MAEIVTANDPHLFWARPSSWPVDGPDAIFLAHAIHQIAHERVDGWTGKEPELSIQIAPPTITEIRKGRTVRLIVSALTRDLPKAQLQSARERFRQAQKLTIEALLGGELIAVSRPLEGGAFSAPFPPSLWHTERNEFRFALCRINPSDPFAPRTGSPPLDGDHWIFITSTSVKAYLRRHSKKTEVAPGSVCPVLPTISTGELGRRYDEHCQQIVSPGGKPPNRDDARKWAKTITDYHVPETMICDVHDRHSKLMPRLPGRPRARPVDLESPDEENPRKTRE